MCLTPLRGKQYRGTADAVLQNLSLVKSKDPEFVIILSGDHVYHMDYTRLLQQHIQTNADLTLATVPHPLKDAHHFGVVEVDRDATVVGFVEKPAQPQALPSNSAMALVNMGVYIFKADVLAQTILDVCDTGAGADFGRDVIPTLIPSNRVFAYEHCHEISKAPLYWRDIGTIESFYDASMDALKSDPPFDPFLNESHPSKPTRHPALDGIAPFPAQVHKSAQVTRSVVSAGVEVGENATVEDSILMPGVRVGRGARLRRVIVEESITLPEQYSAGFDLTHARRAHAITDKGIIVVGRAHPVPIAEPARSRTPAHFITATA
jgi:glucose-1-phosphate adenylyltransferase